MARFLLILALMLVLSACKKPAEVAAVSGKWECQWADTIRGGGGTDTIIFLQDGENLTGNIRTHEKGTNYDGLIKGTVRNGELDFKYKVPGWPGWMKLKLSTDGKMLSGSAGQQGKKANSEETCTRS
jgi:hypothetical protein